MIKIINTNLFKITVFIIVFVFTFILRAHNYDRTPPMAHLEELMFAWAGIHLIERGTPVAWTSLNFPERATYYIGEIAYKGGDPKVNVRLVQPWLEHPPLFSLLVGGSAHYFQANREEVIPAAYIRFPMIFIAAGISILIFLIARLISGYWVGILSMFIYGITPIMVFGSRMAVPENFIAFIYLIVIYLLLKFQKKPNFWFIAGIPLLVGIAGLSKATGFFIIFLAIYVVFTKKWYKDCLYLLLLTLPFVGLFFAYGLYYDPEIFWHINAIQSNRPAGFASLAWIFSSPGYDIVELIDGWFIFCMLATAYFIFSPPDGLKKFIMFAFVYWIIIVMISGGERDMLPWYRFPSYPLLAIIGVWGLQLIFQKANYFASFLVVGLFLGNRYLLFNAFRPADNPMEFRLVFTGLMLPSLASGVFNSKWLVILSKTVIVIVFIVGAYFNSVYIYNAFEIECESKTCPLGHTTKLSTLYFPLINNFFVLGKSEINPYTWYLK